MIAIDVDASGTYITAGAARKGQVAVERALALPDDFTAGTAEAGKKLREALKQAGISPGPAIVLIGRDRLVLKEVKHPAVPPPDEPAVVRFQAVRDISENPDELSIDYLPLGTNADGSKRANVFFARKDIIKSAKSLCDAAGLKLVAVTPRQYAVVEGYRAALAAGTEPPDNADDAVGIIYPAGNGAEFVVLRGPQILFSRPITQAALQSESSFVGELRRNLAIVAGQVPGGVTAIYLAEADAPGGGWAGRLADNLPIPVRTFDPLAGSAAATTVPPQFAGRFAAPAGAIRLTSLPGPLPINFVTPRAPKAEPDKNRTKYLLAALAAVAFIGGLFLGGYYLIGQQAAEISKLTKQRTTSAEILASSMMNAKRVDAANEFMGQQVRLHDELYDWTDMAPSIDSLRVQSINYKLIPLPTNKERQAEEKRKTTQPNAKTPPKPVGTVQFTLQSNDGKIVEQFFNRFNSETRYYTGVRKESGLATGTGKLNQTYNLHVGIIARNPEQYTRRMNLTLPKPRPKSDLDDEFGSFAPINADGGNR